MWVDGVWSKSGKDARDGKDFRFFSPTFHVDAVRNDPDNPARVVCNKDARGNMGALENDPAFLNMAPLSSLDARSAAQPQDAAKAAVLECRAALATDGVTPSVEDVRGVVERLNGISLTINEVQQYLAA